MADTYEQNLGQKTSLTTNDFIRVVGSDNVSYKQGVSNVAETFAQALPRYSAVTSLKDWGVATNGRGITITNSTTTDTPSQTSTKYGVAWTNSYSDGTNPWANLFWSPTGSTDIYMCQKTNTSAWSDWVKMPTRAEVDALNNKIDGVKAYTISGNKYFSLNSSESTESVPSSVLVFGYKQVAVVSWATAGAGFNTLQHILEPSSYERLSLDGNRVYTGSDANRRLTILAPKQISIKIETS